jgi:hypothetical protein
MDSERIHREKIFGTQTNADNADIIFGVKNRG